MTPRGLAEKPKKKSVDHHGDATLFYLTSAHPQL
jgi:hypothetical protein